jgi:hypothetical protein
MSYSCNVKVTDVQGQDFGATATLEAQQGGGIDISPGTTANASIQVQITADAAQLVKPGALLLLTLSAQ